MDGAYTAGRISRAHVDLFRDAAGRIDGFDDLEQFLVEAACHIEPGGLAAILTQLILASLSDTDAEQDYQKSQRLRGLRISHHGHDLYLRGRLDSTQAQILLDAITPGITADPVADDTRTADQKRADILIDLIGRGMASSRPGGISSITVLVDIDHLHDGHGATYQDGTPIPASAFATLTDTAMVFYLVGRRINATFAPLAVAREKRFATPAQWKALTARDRGCLKCGATPRRCHAHHILSWRHGGSTDLSNMCLLCSACHNALHNGHYTISVTNGIPHITDTTPRRAPP